MTVKANAVTTTERDGQDHGTDAGFAGLGSAGENSGEWTTQDTEVTRDADGNPKQKQFAGGDTT